MLTNLFESRNKTFLNLVKLGDYLGRSLRENVELFSVDGDTVTYLTESGHVIKGNFNKTALKLNNIIVESIELFNDKETYSKLVNKKVNNFLADILENDLHKAGESFESVLGIWETRLHFDRVQKRLTEKCEKFNESLKITSSPEFERLTQIKKDLIKFLKESSNLINIPEIRNTIKLSSVISSSFNIPKVNFEGLVEAKTFEVPHNVNHTLYDHLCKQELIAKELVEARNNLDSVWAVNEKVQKLPSYIYESNENLMQLVAEIITELPYFAMATKKQITNLVENNLDLLTERDVISNKDIKDFVYKIFEFKKPVKDYLLQVLNEKYGVNIQNLTEQPTFNSLIKTQIVIFESLAKLSPKNSVIKKVLYEFSQSLKTKNGVEAIDVSNFLNEVFNEAEYTTSLNETSLMSYLNFDKVADDLGKIGSVLKMIQANLGGGAAGGGTDMSMQPGQSPAGAIQKMAQNPTEGEGEYESDGGELAGIGDEEELEGGEEGEMDGGDMNSDITDMPAMDSEDAADEVAAEEAAEDSEEDGEPMEKGDLVDNLKELETLIATIKDEMGMDDSSPMEGDGEDDMNVLGDEEGESEEGMAGDDDIEKGGEESIEFEEEPGEEEETQPPKKKSKEGGKKPNFGNK